MTPHLPDTVAEYSVFHLLGQIIQDHGGLDKREWNALIGIVTAIVGNVLISFALNIQRYAHIRLNRDKDRRQLSWNNGKTKANGKQDYGTEQVQIAERRAKLNLNAPAVDEGDPDHQQRYHDQDGGPDVVHNRRSEGSSRSSSGSTVRQEKTEDESMQNTTYLKSPYWWAGILLMTIGEAGNFLAYGFAPASIVAPLGVVALVSNCIIAPWLLRERFRLRDALGVVIASGGAVTVVLSAKNSETKMGPDDLWDAITRWEFEVYLGITAALIVSLMWASGKYGDKTILIDLGLVGLFGGYTALSTKGVASLLSDTLWRALTFPITYLLVSILVATALLQIRYVNRALQRFDSTQVIPTQFVLFTLSVIIGSAILYRDFESATLDRVGKFVGGCVLTFLGVYLITSGRSGGGDGEGEDVEDEEHMIGMVDEEDDHEESTEHDEDTVSKRKSSQASITFMQASQSPGRRRLSRQQSNGRGSAPRTPQRFDSSTSSRMSQPLSPLGTDPDAPSLNNPWAPSQESLSARRTLPSMASSPLLPSEAQERPSTPHTHSYGQYLGPPRSDRPLTMTRNSISRMMPGPLISPLSSSLSAIVADSLRRGLDSPTRPRRRSGLAGLRSLRSQRSTGVSEETPLASSSPRKRTDGDAIEAPSPAQRRSRSISFGEFFQFARTHPESQAPSRAAAAADGSTSGRVRVPDPPH